MHNIAQINVARMLGANIEDPIMKAFVHNLDSINQLDENSEGFIWRLKDESNSASNFNPYNDSQIITNISVWENIESLQQFTFKTIHANIMKRRKEWFIKYGKAYVALWWIKPGDFPTVEEAVCRLTYLQEHGPSEPVSYTHLTLPTILLV